MVNRATAQRPAASRQHITLWLSFTAASVAGFWGCSGEMPVVGWDPHVAGIETSRVVVGQSLNFYGNNFLAPDEGVTQLEIEGVYLWRNPDGRAIPEKVMPFTITPVSEGPFNADLAAQQVLRVSRFGPWGVPFERSGRALGTFKGTVKAINVYEDGTEVEDPDPTTVTIEVMPSIVITMLEPVIGVTDDGKPETPGCGNPALRVFSGLPYILEVEAVGFKPEFFIYDVSTINGNPDWVTFTHQVTDGAVDRLGDPLWHPDEIVVFNSLPDNVDLAYATIRVTGIDVDNNSYIAGLPVPVIRPITFAYDGNRELAELYPPVAVYGPIMGGINSMISYAESHTESRQRGVSVGVSDSFLESHGAVSTANWSEGVSRTDTTSQGTSNSASRSEYESSSETIGASYSSSTAKNVSYSSTTGSDWGWSTSRGQNSEEFSQQMGELFGSVSGSVHTEVSGEGGIPGVVNVGGKVGTTVGAEVGGRTADTNGVRSGTSSEEGAHMNESESSTRAYGTATTDSRSQNVSGTYALASQSSLSSTTSFSQATSESVTYNLGGSQGISENYTVGQTEHWSETWVDTSSDTSLLAFSSHVPRGRCAMVYRQTVRYVRTGHLYSHDLCGVRSHAAEVHFNEWSWSPNIAIADECSPLPPSTLPAAFCRIACD